VPLQKAFGTRVDAWLAWQRADEELHKLRGKHEKLKAEGGRVHPDRVHTMLQDIADKESQSLHLKNIFDDISRRCKTEMAHFDVERVEDFRVALDKWLDGLIDRQEDVSAIERCNFASISDSHGICAFAAQMVREWEHYVALLERQTGRTIEVQGPRPNVG
jgi:Vps5 C terminal like